MTDSTKTTDTSVASDFHVPAEFKTAINKLADAQEKGAGVMQRRLFQIGEKLAIVKDEYFGGETQAFGEWLSDNCPRIHQNYVAFYIAMYTDMQKISDMLKHPAHRGKTSPQTIVRTFRGIQEGTLALDGKRARDENGKKIPKKTAGKKDTGEKAPADKPVTLDGMTLQQLFDLERAVASRIYAYSNAKAFDLNEKLLCKQQAILWTDMGEGTIKKAA